MRDEHVDDLIDLYALGALEPNEQAAVDEHLDECGRCRARLAEAKRLVAMLAWTPDQHDPPPELRDRLMRRVQHLKRADGGSTLKWWQRLWPAEGRWGPILSPGLALALAVLALVLGFRTAQLQREVSTLSSQIQTQQQVVAVLRDPNTRLVTLRSQPGAPQSAVQLLVNSERGTAYAVANNLPTLAQDRTYQLWLIDGGAPQSAGIFRVDAQGTATIPLQVRKSLDQYKAVAISVEPAGGSPAPTTNPILVTTL